MATDEQLLEALLALFLKDPAKHADGMVITHASKQLGTSIGTVKRIVRANPANWMLAKIKLWPGARHPSLLVLCLSPAFQGQVRCRGGAGGSNAEASFATA